MGDNINGPSLIKAPDWVRNPLGKYYLYFSHHQGSYIRLAYADQLEGPWRTHPPGVLDLEDSYFGDHIASPEVRIRPKRQEIWMYYHGCVQGDLYNQQSRVAVSRDGLNFRAQPEILGAYYWRTFEWDGLYYAMAMPGVFYRSPNGLSGFEQGPTLFTPDMRHTALRVHDSTLEVFFSMRGMCPECILYSTIDLEPDWMEWKASEPVEVLRPEMDYEGANLTMAPSAWGPALEPVNQLRDPGVFEEKGRLYLLYTVAGEQGIALARISGLDKG